MRWRLGSGTVGGSSFAGDPIPLAFIDVECDGRLHCGGAAEDGDQAQPHAEGYIDSYRECFG